MFEAADEFVRPGWRSWQVGLQQARSESRGRADRSAGLDVPIMLARQRTNSVATIRGPSQWSDGWKPSDRSRAVSSATRPSG